MEVNFTYTYADYAALIKAMDSRGRFARLSWMFLLFIIAVNIAITLFFVIWTTSNGLDLKLIHFANAGIGLLLALVFYVLKPLYLRHYYKKQMLDGKVVGMKFEDFGLKIHMPSFEGTHEWEAIILADEQPEHFQLWINKIQAYVVPKRGFANAQEIETFKQLVSSKVKNQELLQ